ncbi:hypothetical protein WISP_109958 [Willisornis vidua]|uniref:Uncharacterized protein n=1 Tax=Willisornis vidua TaxID=1566151 RepID=A0ABQ9D1P4_9PASS|nr:hypothetical protein WISP_109958 [Willisornis vidua]
MVPDVLCIYNAKDQVTQSRATSTADDGERRKGGVEGTSHHLELIEGYVMWRREGMKWYKEYVIGKPQMKITLWIHSVDLSKV